MLADEAVAPFELTLAHPSGARVTVELALRAVHNPYAIAHGDPGRTII